jgi:type IV secretory pathway TrbD component
VSRTDFYAGLGFVCFMLGLFLWTEFGNVLWAVAGGIALILCFIRSDEN